MVCLLTICLIKSLIQLRSDDNVLKSSLENVAAFLQSKYCTVGIENRSKSYQEILLILAGILTDLRLPDSLDCGKILVWFYCGLKGTPSCDSTMRKLCEAQPNYDSGVDSIIEIVRTAVGGQSPSNVFIQSCNKGIDLVTSYLINFKVLVLSPRFRKCRYS